MPESPAEASTYKGLSQEQVITARHTHGSNTLHYKREIPILAALKSLLKEPMVVLLLAASLVYFISGNIGDGVFMASAIVLVAAISLYQDSRSRNALEKLKKFTQPRCKVIRDGEFTDIAMEDLVVGDYLVAEEGTSIAGDGEIVQSNDFSVNESVLTGEAMPVFKDPSKEDRAIFRGTTVSSGLAIAVVSAVGNKTRLGQIGESLEVIQEERTPLEKQIGDFVRYMVLVGAVVFLIVWGINYARSSDVLDSLLKALTLAMSILPEEIPVAFTTFMALGAWRLMKMGIVVKQMKTVETLGSATVICTDKTGTITENRMSLAKVYSWESDELMAPDSTLSDFGMSVLTCGVWASEPIPFDPMEVALHEAYGSRASRDERPEFKMIHEYPLGGKPPMMTHVFRNEQGTRIIAAKGAPEAIMAVSNLSDQDQAKVEKTIAELAGQGYRVLGVGESPYTKEAFPAQQQDLPFQFKGLVAFYDPPKANIQSVFEQFYAAGIDVKIVTGDNALTTASIARQVGFRGSDKSLSGEELMSMPEKELEERVLDTNLFTRMFPEAKLRIINALKAKNAIVAMTGDGVNDAPALKAAHIGIAMGEKGTEIARQAASLILARDDLASMLDAIAMGRKIYTNLKKAIQYIISIHIPIILTVFIPLALGWKFPNIFSPLHIIFLELIMGPTCSIIYENEPMEPNTMRQKPRPFTSTFFNFRELFTSVVQGLMITVGILLVYQLAVHMDLDETTTRSMVFVTLVSSNIFLTLINRSFYYSVFTTLRYHNNLVYYIISATILLTGLLIFIHPMNQFFAFVPLQMSQLGISILVGFAFVVWFEGIKWYRRRNRAS